MPTPKNDRLSQPPNPLVDHILRPREVCEVIGVSRTTLWRKSRDGEFPRPVRLGANSIGWLATDVQKWIRSRPSA